MDNKMNCYCNVFEEINEFRSPNEFKRFQDYIGAFVDDGKLVEIPVREKHAGFPEQWYKCKICALTWRLVYPDFPYKGLWSVVNYVRSDEHGC